MSKKHKEKSRRTETNGVNKGRRKFMTVMTFLGLARWYARIAGESYLAKPGEDAIRGLVHASLADLGLGAQRVDTKPSQLASDLFFRGADADIVPPSDWQHKEADVEVRPGLKTYEHEYRVMTAMKSFFPNSTPWIVRAESWEASHEHSLICLGSGVSNRATYDFLGDKLNPKWTVKCPEGQVQLAYSMIQVEGLVEREQYGETYRGPASAIVDSSGRRVARPEAPTQQLKEDYLLVTRLPGWGSLQGTSVLIFAGLHGPGTRSAELIFTSIDPKELSYLADKIGLSSNRPTPYFQAVFRASGFCLKDGSHIAQELVCIKEGCPPVILSVV